ncbi:MAG TPA: alpha-L-rhamnosidase C-terminal domain-containing protein [Tepidisphaeraceae bacterium]|jgi:hypothetical protein|nr:alpha-L-rhamnosidase C-terminal domain-containing protein [Tepidisphaeraceae bacterium]
MLKRILFLFLLSASIAAGPPTGLLVNLVRHSDLTILTDANLRFSWIVNDPAQNAVQSAYQIHILTADKQPLWDSGKIISDHSTSVPYSGEPLPPNQTYSWSVSTWDGNDQPSPWSDPQQFNLGTPFNSTESQWLQVSSTHHWTIANEEPVDYHAISPASVVKTPTSYFIDFGRDAFATIRLTLTSPADGTLQIRLGEKKTPDNHVDPHPGGSIYYGVHSLKVQQGTHTYDLVLPRHISKMPHSQILPSFMPEVEPFRYAEIMTPPSEITSADIKQIALFYPFDDDAASFTCSNPDLNAIWNFCKYTLQATPFPGIYTDGVRERMPYEADAYIQTLGQYCIDREYALPRHSEEFLEYHATWPTEWNLLSILIAHADYMNTGDADSLKRNYDVLKAKLLLPLERPDGLISTRTGKVTPALLKSIHYDGKALKDIVDWPVTSESDGYQFAKYNTVVNALHYRTLVLMTDIAAATDHSADADEFRRQADKVKSAFNSAFFDAAQGIYVDGEGLTHSSLHANAFPLAVGLVSSDRIEKVADFIRSRQMACGPYGAQFVVESLYDAHAADAALALLTNHTDRGWLNMLRTGSTMTAEAWDIKYKSNLTWNHAWGAAPANLIPRKLMGVEPLTPGFARVRISPEPGNLTGATLKMPTIRGTILVTYRRIDHTIQLDVTIPANMQAEIHMPTTRPTIYNVGSGTYHFTGS